MKPRTTEINYITQAVEELRSFDDYAKVFGITAPQYDVLLATLEQAEQWSTMRVAMAKWDRFCAHMEKIAWKGARAHLAQLRPAFELASTADPTLANAHVSLAMLVRAMGAIVHKGVATKRANQQAIREGREPLRGKALRAARKAAAKAAVAEAQKKESAPKPPPAPPANSPLRNRP